MMPSAISSGPWHSGYQWQQWVDSDGGLLPIPSDDLLGLDSATAVELTWNYALEHEIQCGPVLSPVLRDRSELRHYHPMQRQQAALFREFAAVDFASPNDILAFAQRYGLLGVPMQTQSVCPQARRNIRSPLRARRADASLGGRDSVSCVRD